MGTDPLEAWRRQQEQIRRVMQSPAFEAIKKQEELTRKLLSEPPVLEAMRKQQEQIRKLISEPPALEAIRREQERVQKLNESLVLKALQKQQEQIRKLAKGPGFVKLAKQQQEMADFWSRQSIEPLSRFREEVANEAIRYAEEADSDVTASSSDGLSGAFFQFRANQYLLWQLKGLLKALEVLTASGDATNELAEEPIVSGKLLALMLMVALIGELMIWLAQGPPNDS